MSGQERGVRSKKAGERAMALLRKLYAKLHLTVNEANADWEVGCRTLAGRGAA